MCTIIFAYGVFDGFAVASNRDESYGRSFLPPSVVSYDEGWHVAPRDDREGGTWLGYNDAGVVATLSNLPVSAPTEEPRSRGLLVADLLRERSVGSAVDALRCAYDRDDYAGFNLVVGSSDACAVAVNDGSLRLVEPDEGVHVTTNTPFDDPGDKARAVADTVTEPGNHATAPDWLGATRPVLASHDPEVCVHDDGRGTTSSSLLHVPKDADEATFRFADGPPCETGYDDVL